MRIKLTEKTVPRLTKPGDHWDTTLPRFGLRISPKGATAWTVLARVAGKPKRFTLGNPPILGLHEARLKALDLLRKVDGGEVLVNTPGLAATVETLMADFLAAASERLRDATIREWRRLAKAEVLEPLGARRAGEVTRAEIRELLRKIGERSSWISNRTHALLSAAFAWGVEQSIVEQSPLVGLHKLHAEPSRDRVLSPDELRAVLLAANEAGALGDCVWLMALTCVRLRAILGTRVEELDLPNPNDKNEEQRGLWTLPAERSKNRKAHLTPLVGRALKIMVARARDANPYLFPAANADEDNARPEDRSSKRVRLLVRRAEEIHGSAIAPWQLRDLKRTAATFMREQLDIAEDVVSRLAQHSFTRGAEVTKIYDRSHLLRQRREALTKWDAYLRKLVAGKAQKRGAA
jgi:integrase